MNFKRMLAGLLVAATLCGLGVVPASAAEQFSGFSDISDPATAEAAETLRLLGVVAGVGNGYFNPAGTLTRGEFCKMAVMTLGRGEEAGAQENRTIFHDVRGDHWARGYINLAATPLDGTGADGKPTKGESLMAGKGDGSFHPNDKTTYAEAVTIMMRMLGYTTADIASGATWYDGYLATADAIGLTEGVLLPHDSAITRGQTAILFENLLYLKPRGKTEPYLTATLGGKLTAEMIVLDLNATTEDGVTGAIAVTDGTVSTTYKSNHLPFNRDLAGLRVKLALDKNSRVLAILPSTVGTQRIVSLTATPEITYLTVSGGERLEVAGTTPVYKNGEKKSYQETYVNLKPGTKLSLHYAATGKLEYIFVPGVDYAVAAVATMSADPFSALLGQETDYRVIKNGLPATTGDVRVYDVATYDKQTHTLLVSDLRLTGVYEDVKPSPVTPLEVTVLGAKLPVLSSAFDDLGRFKIGDTITLLLTADGQVAGAVPPGEARSTTVGVAKITDTSAVVTPLADLRDTAGKPIELKGQVNSTAASAAKLQGQLVTVSSAKVGELSLAPLASGGSGGALDVAARTLGGAPLADNVYLYERVGNGVPVRISFDQITRKTLPATQISYVNKDYAGRVSVVVLNDATGDGYTYGLGKTELVTDNSGGGSTANTGVLVEYATGKTTAPLIGSADVKKGSYIGVAASMEKLGSNARLASWLELKSIAKVPRAAFEMKQTLPAKQEQGRNAPLGTVSAGGMLLPISGDVVCYNKSTKKWFSSLDEARAYSDNLTVYYDRAPQDGGKVRVVVAE